MTGLHPGLHPGRLLALLTAVGLAATALDAQAPPAAAAPRPLTLRAAVARALAANAGLERARGDVAVAQADVRASRSRLRPDVTLGASLVENSREATFNAAGREVAILPRTDWDTRLAVTQTLFDGLRDRRSVRRSELGVGGAEAALARQREELVLRVVSSYLAAVQAEALIEVERQNVELAERRRRQAENLAEAGEVTRVDVLRASAAVKAAERGLAEAKRVHEAAVGRMRFELVLEGDLELAPPERDFPPLPDADALGAGAARRPELAEARKAVEGAELAVAIERGAHLPTVVAEGAWIGQRSEFPAQEFGSLGLRVSVPLFQGGRVAARVDAAEERAKQARLREDETRRAIAEEVRQSLVDLETAETRLRLARERLTAAEAEYDQIYALYQALEVTSLDAETSELALAEARRDVVVGQLERDLAEARVRFAAGELGSLF